MGQAAARHGAERLRAALAEDRIASMIVATGTSQFATLGALLAESIDWSRVTGFHLDEYCGLSIDHPASFRAYLRDRFVEKTSPRLASFHYLNAEDDAEGTRASLSDRIRHEPIEVAFVGIGENGHLAFNDPPADFETDDPYLIVDLDERCRLQQVGEGWFPDLAAVPTQAISMSVAQIMKSARVVCTVPDERKAEALRNTLEGPVDPMVPASILQRHPDCTFFVDEPAASMLKVETIERLG